MRAILIDPELRQIREIEVEDKLSAFKEALGLPEIGGFGLAQYDDGFDYGWVDDMGLARGLPVYAFKFMHAASQPIAGKCLIVGVDLEGENRDVRAPLSFFLRETVWLDRIVPEVTIVSEGNTTRMIVTYKRATP